MSNSFKEESVSEVEIRKVKKVGIIRSSANFVNAVLGSGVLSIPVSIERIGFIPGTLLLMVIIFVTDYAAVKMIEMGKKVKAKSFEDLSEKTFGKWLFVVTCVFCSIFSIGALSNYAYLIEKNILSIALNIRLDKNELKNILNAIANKTKTEIEYSSKDKFWAKIITILIFVLIIAPLSLLKDLGSLSFMSIISVGVFLAIFVTVTVVSALTGDFRTSLSSSSASKFITNFGSLNFALVCTDSIFPVYNSLKNNTKERWSKVSHISILSLGSIYMLFMIICYWMINQLGEYVLDSRSITTHNAIVACHGLLAFTLVGTYPVVSSVNRTYIYSIIEIWAGPTKEMPNKRFYIMHFTVTLSCIVLSIVLGMFNNELTFINNMTGLISSTIVGFVIPAMIIYKVKTFTRIFEDFKGAFRRGTKLKDRLVGFADFLVPILMMILGLLGFFVGMPIEIKNRIEG